MKQLASWPILGIWAALTLSSALFASWEGYGGRPFAAMLTCFAFLLLTTLWFAARGVSDSVSTKFGPASGVLLSVCVLFAYLLYVIGTGSVSLNRVALIAALLFFPLVLAL